MIKKLIAVILMLVMFVSVLWFVNPFESATMASANTFKSGISIVPEKEDAAGVLLDSGFILNTESDFALDYLKANVAFRSGELFTISNLSDNEGESGNSFMVKPVEPLVQNRIYFIDVKTPIGDTVTFAFQTKRDFTVLGSLPADMSSYVPVDTGIELYFSYPDVENIAKHFEITPNVKGRFETNGYTTVFIPKELKAGTIYTVTVQKGLKAAGGAVELANDYSFSFETSADPSNTADPYKGSLQIGGSWIEFGTTETPVIPFYLHMREGLNSADVNLKLYRFNTLDDFIKAINKKEEAPYWASYASSKNLIDSSKLNKVLEFKQTFDLSNYQQKYMTFPDKMDHGYYLIELTSNDLMSQAFMQITDIASYSTADEGSTLFWLNDLKTKAPVKAAEIFDYELGKGYNTDGSGLARIPSQVEEDDDSYALELYRVTTTDGKVSLINNGYKNGYYNRNNTGLNWQYVQTDRSLYKPDDTVEFWGYVKSRIDGTSPDKVTVEVARGGYYFPMRSAVIGYFFPSLSNALETLTLKTQDGFYQGSIDLPDLEPGSYSITIKDGDEIISNSYLNVENYIKPQYKLEITSDKNAVFVDEEITFTIKASFFDGTPVSNVPLRYYIYDYSGNVQGTGVTDKDGILTIKHTPKYQTNMQGQTYSNINVSAEFPETGEIHENYTYYTFANDITISSKTENKDGKAIVDFTVNNVDLTTLNDEDSGNDDYVGAPVSGKKLNLKLVHIIWEKVETGEEYDAINKVVRKLYTYNEKKTTVDTAVLTTSEDGTVQYSYNIDPKDEGYYIANVSTEDGNNRPYKHDVYLSSGNVEPYYRSGYDYYTLKADKESYKEGETVNVQVYKNDEEELKNMTTLFVEARNGIQNYQVNNQPKHSMAFLEGYAPNYYINGIVFTGKGYISTSATIIYDFEQKNINLDITTDKDSYRPGENMTIKIKATDINGQPVSGKVNVSMVDEALLKLSGQYIDTLNELYRWIGSGIIESSTNRYSRNFGGDKGWAVDTAAESTNAAPAPMPSAAPTAGVDDSAEGGGAVNVRSDFKDTALFKTLDLDSEGICEYTFKLPDNITSFSLAAAAISNDLHAGSDIQSTKVSMPFFINDSLSLDYLVGDKPYVGLTAYGDGLEADEKISFELTIKELPAFRKTADAKSFERVNIPLPKLTEGTFTLVMSAESASGKKDALSRTITVYPSYRTIEKSWMNTVSPGMTLTGGKNGLTTLIFSDIGKARLLNSLHALSWDYGKRLDQKLVSNHARILLQDLIKNDEYYIDQIDVDPNEYKNHDGGYGILPYAESDITFTALITPLLKDVMETSSLKMYFYDAVMAEKDIQAAALFALAELGEPVLLDLNRAAQIENLTLEDYIYLGMGFEAIGDTAKATDIYHKKVAPELERKDPYIRVKVNRNDTDTSYKQTALAALFAARINNPDAESLFNYVENNFSKTEYVGVEKILYLSEMAENLDATDASFEYRFAGKSYTVDLSDGRSEVVKVPSTKINDLRITKVTGDVSVLSLFTGSFTENVKNDSGITLSRKYYDAATGEAKTTFKANDIVKVEITYTLDKAAIDNTYEISDYAPAGLKPLDNPWGYGLRNQTGCWYRQFEGQKVTFVVGKYEKDNPPKPLVYYARVASPGEYTAEGAVAQGSMVKSSIVTIDDTTIKILP